MTDPTETILQEADRLVSTDRQADYGHPLDNFQQIAALWSPILGIEVTPEQAALCMVGVKISRECHSPKRDNRVDGAGYFKVLDLIVDERERRAVRRAVMTPSVGTRVRVLVGDNRGMTGRVVSAHTSSLSQPGVHIELDNAPGGRVHYSVTEVEVIP